MRGGSKGVPNKNLRFLHGKPLMAYTIIQAKECKLFEHIVVSTDSSEIFETAKSLGAEAWFLRPPELATDEVSKLPVIRHVFLEAEKYYNQRFDVLFDLDVTSPLRIVEDIIGAFSVFTEEDAENLITACRSRRNPYFNMVEQVNGRVQKVKEIKNPPTCRQNTPEVFDMNASIYIWKRKAILENDSLFTDKTSLYIMPEERSLDIDTKLDWEIAEFIMFKNEDEGN